MDAKNLHLFTSIAFIFLQIHAYFFTTTVEGLTNATIDKSTLLSFKLTVTHDPRNFLTNWTPNTSHCSWHGVTCSIKGSRVRSLNLSGLGLFAPLPPKLSNLTSLFSLDLTGNSFYGRIPSDFGLLSHLQYLFLAGNSINGTVPDSLSRCRNLRVISLSSNRIYGDIPPQLGSLQRLQNLDLYNNSLSGSVPTTFGNLTSLSQLSLGRNRLSGEIPTELGRLKRLKSIQLSENRLSGEIPSSVFNISSLEFLSLTDNQLSGKLPEDMGFTLPNLRELYLAQNRIEGKIPSSLSNVSSIQQLDLSFNGFQGPVPLFGNMNDLVFLNLGNNNLTSNTILNFQLIDSLKNCTRLEVLKVFSNNLSGFFPNSVANLSTHLQHFCFSDNFLSGRFPEGMEKFQDLISLSIEENQFSGEIPITIGALRKLQNFLAYSNKFSGEIPDVFGNFSQLSSLWIGDNMFSGGIPSSIGSCRRLNTLGLGSNRLNGNIPKEIFGLSTLVVLYLRQNSLTGPLPGEVGSLKQVQSMDLSDNKLSGNISSSNIGSCWSLQHLNLARNNFSGFIPGNALGNLESLETLDLSSNSLTGPIPEELEKLQYLVMLNLSFNDLEGQIPPDGIFLNLTRVDLEGNNRLCHSNQRTAEKLGLPHCIPKTSKRHNFVKIIVLAVVIAFAFVILFCFVCAYVSRKKQKTKSEKRNSFSNSFLGLPPKISYTDIRQATDNFAAENLIGKGGFGSVYRGVFRVVENGHGSLTGETILAIKIINLQQNKALKSFDAECEALRNVRHRNLVKLVTSCSSIQYNGEEFKALVMEFMTGGSLDRWLYREVPETSASLNLLQRLNIAIDVASAMDYLHHDCNPPVVHCDLKPENVLLDNDMVAHVGDFGLARILSQDSSGNIDCSTVGLKGSIGYIPPEYGMGGKASTAGDVYSFGILLLEIFIAKRPTDGMFKDGLSLDKFASAVNESNVLEIADRTLFNNNNDASSMQSTTLCDNNNDASSMKSTTTTSRTSDENSRDGNKTGNGYWQGKGEECVGAVVGVGLACASHSATDRLTMRQALMKLQEIKKLVLEI